MARNLDDFQAGRAVGARGLLNTEGPKPLNPTLYMLVLAECAPQVK